MEENMLLHKEQQQYALPAPTGGGWGRRGGTPQGTGDHKAGYQGAQDLALALC